MHPVLKNTYNYFENIKGKKLVILLLSLLVVFLTLGILLCQLPTLLNGKTNTDTKTSETTTTNSQALVERAGKVVYSDPSLFPKDEISYKLIDSDGKLVILLKAGDDKLKVIEGATVRLKGKLQKTTDGSEVLVVEQVI